MQQSEQNPSVTAEQGRLILPEQALEQALRRIEPDGSVQLICEEDDSWQRWGPHRAVEITHLPPDVFANRLLEVARTICGTVSNIQLQPASQEKELRLLALYLNRYRNHMDFLRHAASLTQVTADGEILHPHLPQESPWRWAGEVEYRQVQG
jgi:hypothetical protein